MRFRKRCLALPTLLIGWALCQESHDGNAIPENSSPGTLVTQGLRALDQNLSDSARIFFLEARALGLSADSLYYFLAETALKKFAYDTALVFNLSISPAPGAFQEQVLRQRYRLYSLTGLGREAEFVRDSLEEPEGSGRKKLWERYWGLVSGYGRETYFPVYQYPFQEDLGALESNGWLVRNQAGFFRALPGAIPMMAGFGYDAGKAYYKDSVDFRASASLKSGNPVGGPALGLSAIFGRVTGAGDILSGKVDGSYLFSFHRGFASMHAGYEAEWLTGGTKRDDVFWMTTAMEFSFSDGQRGSFMLSGSRLRMDPQNSVNSLPAIYVDDVRKFAPVHYRTSSFNFRDTLLPGPTDSATYSLYTGSPGTRDVIMESPQGFFSLTPSLEYSFSLPFGFSGAAEAQATLLFYPDPYSWEETPLPIAANSGDFQALALNRVDRQEYGAVLRLDNGTLREFYSAQPLAQRIRYRRDRQWRGRFSLAHGIGNWGSLGLEATLRKTESTLSEVSSALIPSRETGLALKWSHRW